MLQPHVHDTTIDNTEGAEPGMKEALFQEKLETESYKVSSFFWKTMKSNA